MTAKQNWIVIYGNAEITNGSITHVPERQKIVPGLEATDGTRKPLPPHTIVRSNVEFEQGTVSWEVFLSDADGICQLLLPADPTANQGGGSAADPQPGTTDCELTFGVNVLGAPYGFAFVRNYNWEPVIGVGQGSKVPTNRWIRVSTRVSGSNVDMYVDDVKIISTSRVLRRGQVSLFMQGNSPIKFRNLEVDTQEPLCFVVMQFSAEFDVLYKDVIKPVCEHYGYRVIRGDDFSSSGQIMEDITQSIRNAALIIADVTPDNANVFYEVGYAHAIGKPTILLSDRKRERLPFDISGFRTLFYDNTIGGKTIVEERLKQHLDALRPR
jgi:hypothetical protein